MDLLWKDSGEHFQAFEEELPFLRKGDLAIAAVPDLEEGLNRLFDGLSNPIRNYLTRENFYSFKISG